MIRGEENVAWFEITMCDVVGVNPHYPFRNLHCDASPDTCIGKEVSGERFFEIKTAQFHHD
jgi:hypothetical protein